MVKTYLVGKTIAKLRKEAHLTQAQLAEKLCISDKAVSKWERGLSLPDVGLFPILSKILDCEIDYLLTNNVTDNKQWTGMLYLENLELPLDMYVYDKPLLSYLLTPFLLAGITKVLVVVNINNLNLLNQFVLRTDFGISLQPCLGKGSLIENLQENAEELKDGSLFLWYGSHYMYGLNLTRHIENCMNSSVAIQFSILGNNSFPKLHITSDKKIVSLKDEKIGNVPKNVFFLPNDILRIVLSCDVVFNLLDLQLYLMKKNKLYTESIGRGMLDISINNFDEVNDFSNFVKLVQNNLGDMVSCIEEIATRNKK